MRWLSRFWRQIDVRTRKQILTAVTVPGVIAILVAIGSFFYAPFGEFVRRTLAIVLGMVATPFAFETTFFLVGVGVVLVAGVLRSRIEHDEWMLPEQKGDPADADSGESVDVLLAVAEGHLELGSSEEAWNALMQVPRKDWDSVACQKARLRYCAMVQRWAEGDGLLEALRDSGSDHAEERARYLVAHATDLVDRPYSGESGNQGVRIREVERLVAAAVAAWPQIGAEIADNPVLLAACDRSQSAVPDRDGKRA